MARPPRLSLPSYPHHVIQRGNNRQPIFLAPKDYEVFLDCLREAKRKCRARLYAYVLMTNHVHLLLEPEQEGDLGRYYLVRAIRPTIQHVDFLDYYDYPRAKKL